MTRWLVVGGGTAGCVVAATLAAGRPDDDIVVVESGPELGGASLVNGGVVVGPPDGTTRRLPLEAPGAVGPFGAALLAADPRAALVRLARRDGRRVSVAEAYLDPLPANVHVMRAVTVERVLVDGATAVGVVGPAGELAGDRVVVCAGAIGTPALLLRSGVTAAGIGRGLQNHVGVTISAEFAPWADAAEVTATAEHGDHQIVAVEPNRAMGGYGALVGGLMVVHGTGSVTLDGDDQPVVDPGRLAHPGDAAGLAAATSALLAIAGHDAVRALAERWYVDADGTTLDALLAAGSDAIATWAASAASPYHHAAGTCRLGTVTDAAGWVVGVRGLALADASVLAGVPPRNPYLAVIDVAARLSSGWVRYR